MSNNIRKFLNLLESNGLTSDKTFLEECMDEETKTWYLDATNQMISRIRAGEYPIDVINELAREYSWKNGGSYESFGFARDALDRRAWEMGLRYTDEADHRNMDNTQSFHDTLITPQVTEDEEDPILEELINEVGFIDRIVTAISPERAAKVMSDRTFKQLSKEFVTGFKRQYGFGDSRNVTLDNALKYLVRSEGLDPNFVKTSTKDFLKKFPKIKTKTFDERAVKSLFVAVAAEIMIEGGKEYVTKGNYESGESDKADTVNTNSNSNQDTDTREPDLSTRKTVKLKTVDDIIAVAQKAMKGTDDLSAEELHDIGVLLQRFTIPTIRSQTGKNNK